MSKTTITTPPQKREIQVFFFHLRRSNVVSNQRPNGKGYERNWKQSLSRTYASWMENQETIIPRVEPHDVHCLFLAFMSLLNKWSLSTYYIQMIMLDVLWDWTHAIEDILILSSEIFIYIYKVCSQLQLKAPSISTPPMHHRQSSKALS